MIQVIERIAVRSREQPGWRAWWRRFHATVGPSRLGATSSDPSWRQPSTDASSSVEPSTPSSGSDANAPEGMSLALDALYRAHAPTILNYLSRRLPTLADAEDALMDVFLAALARDASGREVPGVVWLMRVAHNRVADYYRTRGRRPTTSVDIDQDALADDPARSPEQWVLRDEEHRQLAVLVAHLPDEQREALELRFAAGLRSAQIAAVLGKSDEATRQILSRALRTLRKEWRA